MTAYKKTAGDGVPQAASKLYSDCHYNPIHYHLKATVCRPTLWLFLLGDLHA